VKNWRRRIVNALVALSLVLLAGVVLLWVRSYAVLPRETLVHDYGPSWAPDARRTQWAVQSFEGRLSVGRLTYSPKKSPTWAVSVFGSATADGVQHVHSPAQLDWIAPRHWWERWGFAWRHTIFSVYPTMGFPVPLDEVTYATVPYWALALLFAMAPALRWLAIVRRRRRRRKEFCARCGYDLRATPNRCPECGLEVS
jgi:hypothetical protein